jgi:hypothetical protein
VEALARLSHLQDPCIQVLERESLPSDAAYYFSFPISQERGGLRDPVSNLSRDRQDAVLVAMQYVSRDYLQTAYPDRPSKVDDVAVGVLDRRAPSETVEFQPSHRV